MKRIFFAIMILLWAATAWAIPPMPYSSNAATATALAANGANCSSGQAPLGVDASGAVESCFAVQASDALLTAIAGLTTADVSIIQLTGTDTAAVLTCTANQVIGANAAGDALECKSSLSITSFTDTVKIVDDSDATKTVVFDLGTNLDANDDVTIKIPDAGADVTWTMAMVENDNTFSAVQTFDATAGLKVGSTGVLITSDNDGLITFLGTSGGYDEDMTINLDDTEDTIVIGSNSGVTSINTGSIAFVTTGYIQGAIKIASDADGMDATATAAAGMYGTLFVATGAGTWILPAAAEGMNFCLLVTTSDDVIIDIDASDDITLVGVQDTDGDGVTNATGSSTGDFICMIAIDATHWYVMGKQGTWTAQ